MINEYAVSIIAVTGFKIIKIFFVFLLMYPETRPSTSSADCEVSFIKLHKPLENVIDFFIVYIIYKEKMKLVVIINEIFIIAVCRTIFCSFSL